MVFISTGLARVAFFAKERPVLIRIFITLFGVITASIFSVFAYKAWKSLLGSPETVLDFVTTSTDINEQLWVTIPIMVLILIIKREKY